MDKLSKLEKINELKEKGAITEEEFLKMKKDIMDKPDTPIPPPPEDFGKKFTKATGIMAPNEDELCMYMHLSHLCGYFIPFGGAIVPIMIWQMNKDKSEKINEHGIHVTNWIISETVYFFISILLSLIIIGYVGIAVVAVLSIVYPIMGAVKAKDGEVWRYPGTINFIKPEPKQITNE